jgi:vacuolar-type H+-ATPase subunit H
MIHELYAKLEKLIADAKADLDKAAGGNKAAGTRARKHMQEVRSIAADIRKAILDNREKPTP